MAEQKQGWIVEVTVANGVRDSERELLLIQLEALDMKTILKAADRDEGDLLSITAWPTTSSDGKTTIPCGAQFGGREKLTIFPRAVERS